MRLVAFRTAAPYTGEIGAVFTLSGSGSVTTTAGTATIESVGNGWYRCTGTGTAGTSASHIQVQIIKSDGSDGYAGDGYSGVICSKIQYELGSFASSPISTSGTTATRAADSLSLATSSFYTGGPVTLFAEASMQNPSADSSNRAILNLKNSTATTDRVLVYNAAGKADGLYVKADNATSALLDGSITTDAFFKYASRISTDSFARSTNGGAVSEDTSGQLPKGLDTLEIGGASDTYALGGHIKRVALYSEDLTDTNLQALTS